MSKAKILIVEDDVLVAMDIERCLKKLGYSVSGIVNYAEKAIEKVEELKPDLVLMDIVLKGEMDGIEAAEIIRSRFDIPVVFLTAYADEERFERAKFTIPFGYVLKPFQDRDLKIILEMALYTAKVDTERKQAEEALKESENRFRQLAEGTFEAVVLHEEGIIFHANDQYYKMFGYEPHELIGKDAIALTTTPDSLQLIREQISLGNLGPYEVMGLKKDGMEFPMEIRAKFTEYHGRKIRMSAIRDLTNRKIVEKELEIKANDLEELNAALKVLLKKRQEDKVELEEGILSNVRTLIKPYLDKLKKSKLPQNQKTLLNILESNLNEIISLFTKRLSSQYLNLTPKEIKIANLVKQGKTNKEIAEIQGVTSRTIAAHRENIRKKLSLTNKKTNLRTYLQTLD